MSAFPIKARFADVAGRPAYYFQVPHAYFLGGLQKLRAPGIALDEIGLRWVRSFVLWSQAEHVGYRMVDPEDLPEIVGHEFPSADQVGSMYGHPGAVV